MTQTFDADALAARVAGEDVVVLVRGPVRANPARAEMGLLGLGPVRLVARGSVELDRMAAVLRTLEAHCTVRRGRWRPWEVAWTTDDGPLQIFTPDGVLWCLEERGLVGPSRIGSGEIEAVEAFVSEDWVRQGVAVRPKDGDQVEILALENLRARRDPGYDALRLSWDTSWCVQLGRTLSEHLSVPFEDRIRDPRPG